MLVKRVLERMSLRKKKPGARTCKETIRTANNPRQGISINRNSHLNWLSGRFSSDSLEASSSEPTTDRNRKVKHHSIVSNMSVDSLEKKQIHFESPKPAEEYSSPTSSSSKDSSTNQTSEESLDAIEAVNINYKLYSIIYAMIIIVLGVILPIVETAMKGVSSRREEVDNIFEIMLFSVSIIWFLYCFIDINLFKRRRRRASLNGIHLQNYSHDTENPSGGLYLRIGCGLFCMAAMLHNGLLIAEAFEFQNFCGSIIVFVKYILRFIFTFVQFAFIFRNINVVIQKSLLFSHLSVAHIIVTNICVWFKFILEETFESVKYSSNDNLMVKARPGRQNSSTGGDSGNSYIDSYNCVQTSKLVSDIIEKLNPYLHPCTIEYSIISVTIFCLIWYDIGRRKIIESHLATLRRFSLVAAQIQIFHVDCNKTTKGLLAGFLVSLLNAIVLILFIVSGVTNYATTNAFKLLSLYLTEGMELVLMLLILSVCTYGFITMRKLKYIKVEESFSIGLDEVLQIFALFGVLSFGVFRILAFRYSPTKGPYVVLLLINGILSFIQGLLQTVFILKGLKKRSTTGLELKQKKGRDQITFLIIINLSLWLSYSVTRNKYANILFKDVLNDKITPPIYTSEYVKYSYARQNFTTPQRPPFDSSENAQAVKWIIINTITYPLLLYFYFHSSYSLSIMWKICYSLETE